MEELVRLTNETREEKRLARRAELQRAYRIEIAELEKQIRYMKEVTLFENKEQTKKRTYEQLKLLYMEERLATLQKWNA